ncbi:TetR/AcrR family transcriptional regulator [Periweissella cryptocerci]|uniref:TetR/AcrR family transcriptional regulator n=1 Tax=Periweissella cryptocerci TaxID=2506420 RepID=A0A4V1AIP2_9LACO|nr:TetR/AcrR family transcriptional regulator [Periweissella cryptocerci]QBO36195.1 TetR/AcrR family transcriptional regulator [Periweissella cryptocerci]
MVYEHKTQQTRELLLNTLLDLVAEKDFEKITIRDITEKAQVNRGTFYRHFQDKMDLIEQKERQIFADFEELQSRFANKYYFSEKNGKFDLPTTDLIMILTYLYSQRRFMAVMLSQNGDLSFEHDFAEWFYQVIESSLKAGGNDVDTKHMKIVLHYQVAAMLGVIRYWFIDEQATSTPEQIANEIIQINRSGVWANLG